ncbi:MAG TPA: cytochrome c [Anaeromyxobacter sp.]
MKRILFALAALSLAGAARADSALFAQKCASCHGKDGKPSAVGQKMGAKDLSGTKLSEKELVTVISGGKGKMPAYKEKLTDDQIASLAKYIAGGLK